MPIEKPKIMLLGSIPKGDEVRAEWKDWKEEYMTAIRKEIPEARFLDGDLISDKEGPEAVVGHDLWLVKAADIIIVDAPKKIGAGTAQEMVIAKHFQKPVVTMLPRDTHHRRSNVTFHGATLGDWIHPFLFISSDYVAESVSDAAQWVKSYAADPGSYQIKDIAVYEDAIKKFEDGLPEIIKNYRNQGW